MGSTFLNGASRPASNMLSRLGGSPASSPSPLAPRMTSTDASRSFQRHAEINNLYGQHRAQLNAHMNAISESNDHPQVVAAAAQFLSSIGAGGWNG